MELGGGGGGGGEGDKQNITGFVSKGVKMSKTIFPQLKDD